MNYNLQPAENEPINIFPEPSKPHFNGWKDIYVKQENEMQITTIQLVQELHPKGQPEDKVLEVQTGKAEDRDDLICLN